MSELGLPAFGGAEPALLSHVALVWRLAGRASNTRLTARLPAHRARWRLFVGLKPPLLYRLTRLIIVYNLNKRSGRLQKIKLQ